MHAKHLPLNCVHYFFCNTQGTVGAGLPVIGTLKHLVETGDKVEKVEGVFRCVCVCCQCAVRFLQQ